MRLATFALALALASAGALACSSPTKTTVTTVEPTAPTVEPVVAMTAPSEFADQEGLLRYLRVRMAAPTGAWGRVARARAVVLATVTRSDIIPNEASAAFLADPAVQSLAIEVGGKRNLFVAVVDLAIDRWFAGRGGAGVTGVWLAPLEMTSETVTLPLVGTRGVVTLDALPATTLGRELATSVPGAYEMAPLRPLFFPTTPELTAAIELARAAKRPSMAGELARARGGALQITLGAIVRGHDAAAAEALRARAQGSDLDALLVRAALFDLGDAATALAGWDVLELDLGVRDALGIVMYERSSGIVLVGPSSDTPLPWQS